MFLTTNLYRAVTEPPAHLLHLEDAAVAIREHAIGDDDVIVITSIRHHETRATWHQAFLLTLPMARRLYFELAAHLDDEFVSHDLLRPTDDDDPPM